MLLNTNTNTNANCDFCDHSIEHVYDPINSKRGMQLFVCENCGLLESKPSEAYTSRPPGNMSSDADRSSYRYTKTLVAGSYSDMMIEFIKPLQINKILDIGSNRGAFFKWASKNLEFNTITCIETDETIVEDYIGDPRVDLTIDRLENVNIEENEYDFAFCVHTLEHALSAKGMLKQIFDSLKVGGRFFVAVPNLVWHKDVIEEFFIDPHTFHFNFHVLKEMIKKTGFDIVHEGDPNGADAIFVLEKTNNNFIKNIDDQKFDVEIDIKDSINQYKNLISYNRNLIKDTVQLIHNHCNNGEKYFIWGAGRIFDALIKFGGLKPHKNLFLIDKFLSDMFDHSNGIKVNKPHEISSIIDNQSIVYVASRDYKDEILLEAAQIGFKKSLVFGSELIIKEI